MQMKNNLSEVVILAGGAGVRLGKSANGQQKCLLPIDGKPVLGHVLDGLSEALGAINVIVSVSYKAADVCDFVKKHAPRSMKADFMYDDGGSRLAQIVAATKGKTAGSFLVVAGDIVTEPWIFREVYESVNKPGVLASTAVSSKLDEVDTHALCKVTPLGQVIEVLSPPPTDPPSGYLREMTIRGFSQRFYEYADRYPKQPGVPQLFQEAINDGEIINGVMYERPWIHIGYPDDLKKSMADKARW